MCARSAEFLGGTRKKKEGEATMGAFGVADSQRQRRSQPASKPASQPVFTPANASGRHHPPFPKHGKRRRFLATCCTATRHVLPGGFTT